VKYLILSSDRRFGTQGAKGVYRELSFGCGALTTVFNAFEHLLHDSSAVHVGSLGIHFDSSG
jgi:hypothetical protein